MESPLNKLSMICLGVALMLPWNAILASMDFFLDTYPSYKPSFSLLIAISAPMFPTQALAFFFMKSVPLHFKVTLMFAVSTLITIGFILVPMYVKDEETSYMILIILAVLFGSTYALLQSSLIGVLSAAPSMTLMNKFNLGVGIS